jgi:NADH-quinone oxidoreductase subunit N
MNLSGALSIALPECFLTVAALLLLVVGAYNKKAISLVSLGAGAALVVAAVLAAVGPWGVAFGNSYIADNAAAFAKVFIYGFSAVAVLLGDRWLKRLDNQSFEFPVLIVIAALGMGMMASAGDLISLYIGIELHSLALYVLAAFRRDDARSSEAGLKYFVLGALSSGLLLYGASLIYGFAGSTRFDVIAPAVQAGAHSGVLFGLVFLICGLAFKVSAAPFHMWTPDVYEGAPTPVVMFITTAPKLIGLSAANKQGVGSMLVFMVLYMVDVTGFLACLMALKRDGKPMETLADISGLVRVRPGIALVLTALSFSFLGLPPFSGFWGKFFVFRAALNAGLWPVAVAGLVLSVVAAFFYLRIIKVMWFDPPAGEVDASPGEAKLVAYASALFAFPVVIVALGALDSAATAAASALSLR